MDCDCKVSGYFGAASVVVNEIVYCPTHEKAFEVREAAESALKLLEELNHGEVIDTPDEINELRAALAGRK